MAMFGAGGPFGQGPPIGQAEAFSTTPPAPSNGSLLQTAVTRVFLGTGILQVDGNYVATLHHVTVTSAVSIYDHILGAKTGLVANRLMTSGDSILKWEYADVIDNVALFSLNADSFVNGELPYHRAVFTSFISMPPLVFQFCNIIPSGDLKQTETGYASGSGEIRSVNSTLPSWTGSSVASQVVPGMSTLVATAGVTSATNSNYAYGTAPSPSGSGSTPAIGGTPPPPTVLGAIPNYANGSITLVLSQTIDPTTATTSTVVIVGSAGTVAVSSTTVTNDTITFTIAGGTWAAGTTYTCMLNGVMNASEVALAPYSTSFTVAAGLQSNPNTVAPTVLSVTPNFSSTPSILYPSYSPLVESVTIVMSTSLSVAGTITVTPYGATGPVVGSSRMATTNTLNDTIVWLAPSVPEPYYPGISAPRLVWGAVATISITGAQSLAGVAMAAPYSTNFSTGFDVLSFNVAFTARPLTGGAVISFSDSLDPTTVSDMTVAVTSTPGPVVIPGTYTLSSQRLPNDTITFMPTGGVWEYSTNYQINLTTGLHNSKGNSWTASPYNTVEYTFTTISPPLAVLSSIPASGATGVPVTRGRAAIAITASKSLFQSSVYVNENAISLIAPQGDIGTLDPSVTYSTTTLANDTINLTAKTLSYDTTYTVKILPYPGFEGTDYSGLLSAYTTEFTTVAAPTPLSVLSSTPVYGDASVTRTDNYVACTLVMSDSLDPAWLTTLMRSGAYISSAGNVGYIDHAVLSTTNKTNDTITFTILTPLPEEYMLTMLADVDTGVISAAGALLATTYTLSFSVYP